MQRYQETTDNNSVTDNEGDFSFLVHTQYETVPLSPTKRESLSAHPRSTGTASRGDLERLHTLSEGDLPFSPSHGPLQNWLVGTTRWTDVDAAPTRCGPPTTPRRSRTMRNSIRSFPKGVLASSRTDSVSSIDSEESFREASLKEKCSHLKIVF